MTKYKFEIQKCIEVEVEDTDISEARVQVINNLEAGFYDDEMKSDCYVSDGKEAE
jgi:hypothetical protein